MSLRRPRVWIALFSATIVLFVAVVDMGRTSPGPLTAVHAREPELSGERDCSACHGGWFSSMTGACLECHGPIGEQIETGGGLHGVVDRFRAQRCGLCHSEHNGPGFAIVNARSFSQAGVADPGAFDHRWVGFAMEGRHLEIECRECHPRADDAILPKGERRFLGLTADCAACHEDVHRGGFGTACAECHGQTDFERLEAPGHAEHLPLVGGHADIACRECHGAGGEHGFEGFGDAARRPAPRDCAACHDSPHRPAFVAGAAALAAVAPGAACGACHEAEHPSFREDGIAVTPAQHAASGFLLEAPHDRAACAECHAAEVAEFAAGYPGRGPDECARCHEDPHGGQFDGDPFAAEGCLACHGRLRFVPHDFTAEDHALAAVELTGRHREIRCEACHLVPSGGGPRILAGTPARCEGCHADAHLGAFAAGAAESSPPESGECSRCHGTETFAEVPEGRFDHALWTGFPVRGAHAQAECWACHPRDAAPDEFGRSFGRVADRFGRFEGCGTCHADPHAGGFDRPGHPEEVGGRPGCERCHTETSFRALPAAFDHRLWTGYPLAGAHAEAACSACHPRLRPPEPSGRTWAPAEGRECSDCHEDPHAGQFRVDGKTECGRCHTSAGPSFLAFDHEKDSRFPLGEAHSGLECSACHEPWTRDGDVVVVRYRPLPNECSDCHGDEEEALRRRRGGKKP